MSGWAGFLVALPIGLSVYAFDAGVRAVVRLRDRAAARLAIPPWWSED